MIINSRSGSDQVDHAEIPVSEDTRVDRALRSRITRGERERRREVCTLVHFLFICKRSSGARRESACRHSAGLFAFSPIIERSGYRDDQGVPWTGRGRARGREFDTDRSIDHCSCTIHTHVAIEPKPKPSRHRPRRHRPATCFELPGAFIAPDPRWSRSFFASARHEFLFRQLCSFMRR